MPRSGRTRWQECGCLLENAFSRDVAAAGSEQTRICLMRAPWTCSLARHESLYRTTPVVCACVCVSVCVPPALGEAATSGLGASQHVTFIDQRETTLVKDALLNLTLTRFLCAISQLGGWVRPPWTSEFTAIKQAFRNFPHSKTWESPRTASTSNALPLKVQGLEKFVADTETGPLILVTCSNIVRTTNLYYNWK